MSYDPDHRAILIYQDTATLFKLALPSLFGGLMAVPIVFGHRSTRSIFKILALLASVLLLVWEALYLPIISRLLFPRPIVVVNDQGIDFQPPSPWLVAIGMTMKWDEMAAMFISELTIRTKKRTVTYRFLSVIPKDEETYIKEHHLLSPRKLLLLVLWSKTRSPFFLFEQIIFPQTLDELLSQIRVHYKEQLQANGIEIRQEQKTSIE